METEKLPKAAESPLFEDCCIGQNQRFKYKVEPR